MGEIKMEKNRRKECRQMKKKWYRNEEKKS